MAKPVIFPPGWLSDPTMPLATGSAKLPKTIGIVRVSRWTAVVAEVPFVRMMSRCRPTNSCASARIRSMSPPPHRVSVRTLRPSVQPKSASACVNAERRGFHAESFSSPPMSTPTRRTRSVCCAHATTGHAAALPSPAMNFRRRVRHPSRWTRGAYPDAGCEGTGLCGSQRGALDRVRPAPGLGRVNAVTCPLLAEGNICARISTPVFDTNVWSGRAVQEVSSIRWRSNLQFSPCTFDASSR
jgi:hypothetical protein